MLLLLWYRGRGRMMFTLDNDRKIPHPSSEIDGAATGTARTRAAALRGLPSQLVPRSRRGSATTEAGESPQKGCLLTKGF